MNSVTKTILGSVLAFALLLWVAMWRVTSERVPSQGAPPGTKSLPAATVAGPAPAPVVAVPALRELTWPQGRRCRRRWITPTRARHRSRSSRKPNHRRRLYLRPSSQMNTASSTCRRIPPPKHSVRRSGKVIAVVYRGNGRIRRCLRRAISCKRAIAVQVRS